MKSVQRPDRVELRLEPAQPGAPRPAITVDRLCLLARHDPDDLAEVQLVALAVGQQDAVADAAHHGVHDEVAARRRPGDEGAGARRAVAGERVPPGLGGVDVRLQLVVDAVDRRRRRRTSRTITAPSRSSTVAMSSSGVSGASVSRALHGADATRGGRWARRRRQRARR